MQQLKRKKLDTEEDWDETLQYAFNALTLNVLRNSIQSVLNLSLKEVSDLGDDESLFVAYATVHSCIYSKTDEVLTYTSKKKGVTTLTLSGNLQITTNRPGPQLLPLIHSTYARHPANSIVKSNNEILVFEPFIGSDYYHIYMVYQVLTQLQFHNDDIIASILQLQLIRVMDNRRVNIYNGGSVLKNSELLTIQQYVGDRTTVLKFKEYLRFDSVLALIKMGIFPEYETHSDSQFIADSFLKYAKNEIPLHELEWWGVSDFTVDTYITFKNKLNIVQYCLDNYYTLPLHFVAPELVYQITGRLKTDMHMFQKIGNQIVDRQIFNDLINSQKYFPVTRYAESVDTGLYYGTDENKGRYCGTFYYYEPESTTLLYSPNTLVAYNKYAAVKALLDMGMLDTYYYKKAWIEVENYQSLDYRAWMPDDGKATPYQFVTELPEQYGDAAKRENIGASKWQPTSEDPGQPFYLGFVTGLYATEDRFDQMLCELAKMWEFTGVILTHMVGGTQLVGEFLDVRDRGESFRNLVYLDPTMHCQICLAIEPQYTCKECNKESTMALCSKKCLKIHQKSKVK